MASFLDELEEEHLKDGLFTELDTGVSYPMGFPILDQELGFKQIITLPNGEEITQYRLGVGGGTINMFLGPSSSGKTAAAIQAAYNIIEPFGDDTGCLHFDAENSTEPQRVLDLTGMTVEEYNTKWRLLKEPDTMTFQKILDRVVEVCNKKENDKERYMYTSHFYNINGERITYYKPTVIILDSILRIVTDSDEIEEIQGLTSGGRDAIFRGKFLKNLLGYCHKYNLIVFMINHLGNEISLQPGKGGAKQLPFIPTGKNVPGGEKVVYYSSAIIVWQPINSKETIKTEDVNGYNGLPVKALVSKSRSGPGGHVAILEFVQESGFDIDLTLMSLAKEKNLIGGRNPGSYFIEFPDIKFDTRIFVKELQERPELVETMYRACRTSLMDLVRTSVSAKSEKMEAKRNSRRLMSEIFN